MAFDEVQLPLRIGFGSMGGPEFSTEIVVIDGGFERRNQNWSQARRRFDARTGLHNPADLGALLAFFHARAGRARGFRVKDWSDFTSKPDGVSSPDFGDQIIGTGDGATTSFALIKNYGSGGVSHARSIAKPVAGSISIGVGGVRKSSGWTVDTTTGVVTFAVPPANGAMVTAGFVFDVPCRFDTDRLSVAADDALASSAQIPIIEVRV